MTNLDKTFVTFAKGLFILLVLYGIGMILVVLAGPNELATKLISVWSGMFGAVVGLGSGYLIGRTQTAYEKLEETNGSRESD